MICSWTPASFILPSTEHLLTPTINFFTRGLFRVFPGLSGPGIFFAHYSASTTDALIVGTTTTMFTHVALFSRPISCRIFVWQKQSCSLIVSLVTTSNQQAARAAIGGWGEIQHTCSVELLFVQQLFIGWKNEQLLAYRPGWNKAGKDAVTNTRGGQSTRLRLTLTFLFLGLGVTFRISLGV